ncbi:dCTP pyrophosphatase 1 [Vitis vinifera]|uniref:dCTP pyrophosphatase 1 n=1 Tax=Vitis vinifera TaxID=29760 RepID=A0A438JF63_VITVI|nr:dCTP pyrophosphatase 1 [Vitis vinifera]
MGEVGELSEIFQWREEAPKELSDWKEEEKQHLKELSAVLLYLVRFSDICGTDLGKTALRKVDPNAIKYPISKTNLYSEGSQSH